MKEMHLVIDWGCFFEVDIITKNLTERGLELENYIKHPPLENKIETMSKFYNVHVDDKRGITDFNIYIINDNNPLYDLRNTSKGNRKVNTKLFDLKTTIRQKCPTDIHATDNIQETKHNLKTLGLFDKYYNQIKYKDINEVFDTLNETSTLQWIITHNFDSFDDDDDIDFLTNDYYKFMNILDTTEEPKGGFPNSISDGGTSVRNFIFINNKKKPIDIRYVGDNFYDTNFQIKILETREKHVEGFYVPTFNLHLYSLIYHAIIHKQNISSRYVEVFKNYGLKDSEISRANLKEKLDEFMVKYNYKYVKPEPSVGYFIND
jgi:hypothetical protein